MTTRSGKEEGKECLSLPYILGNNHNELTLRLCHNSTLVFGNMNFIIYTIQEFETNYNKVKILLRNYKNEKLDFVLTYDLKNMKKIKYL